MDIKVTTLNTFGVIMFQICSIWKTMLMALEKRPPREGRFGSGEQSPSAPGSVIGTVPDFIDFHIHLPTFHGNCDALLRGLSGRGCQTHSFITLQ